MLCLLSLLLFNACTSPKSTSQKFLEALNNKEFETALNLVTEDSKPILYNLINGQTQEIPSVKIHVKACASPNNDETQMLCLYEITSDTESFEKTIVLIKENNEWKIDLTQSAVK